MPKVLIVGAGIAGDTLAVLLGRRGWSVTVVEIAPALRTGGQTVDLRGGSREVLHRLGLLDAALGVLVPQRGIAWVDSRQRRLAAMPVEAFGGQGFISKEELLRTDLARLLHEAAVEAGVQYRWAGTVDELHDTHDGAQVRFRSGEVETFDLVVGSDGAHSRVRSPRFGPEARYRRPLGLAHAWFTLTENPTTPDLHGWCLVHNATGRRAVAARPGHAGEQEIGLTFPADGLPTRADHAARLALLDDVFAGAGWRTQEFLSAARTAPDFALDTYDQIHMPTWSHGRVVLLGDAAWCASPLSGLGTALGLHGAAASPRPSMVGPISTTPPPWPRCSISTRRRCGPARPQPRSSPPGGWQWQHRSTGSASTSTPRSCESSSGRSFCHCSASSRAEADTRSTTPQNPSRPR